MIGCCIGSSLARRAGQLPEPQRGFPPVPTKPQSVISSDPNLYVTQPQLPPLEDFDELLKVIWDRKILTNGVVYNQ